MGFNSIVNQEHLYIKQMLECLLLLLLQLLPVGMILAASNKLSDSGIINTHMCDIT